MNIKRSENIKYVVKQNRTDCYLADSLYKDRKSVSPFLKDAHIFSDFELKLASVTILRNRNNYTVYDYKGLYDKEIILDVDKIYNNK